MCVEKSTVLSLCFLCFALLGKDESIEIVAELPTPWHDEVMYNSQSHNDVLTSLRTVRLPDVTWHSSRFRFDVTSDIDILPRFVSIFNQSPRRFLIITVAFHFHIISDIETVFQIYCQRWKSTLVYVTCTINFQYWQKFKNTVWI